MSNRSTEYVTKVLDGDTFSTRGATRDVRLEGVDTPEKGETGFEAAKKALEGLILNKYVDIETKAHDRYNRRIAQVWANGRSVNQAMKPYSK